MLADKIDSGATAGALEPDVHLSGEWLLSLIEFLASHLPSWRDDPRRPPGIAETQLTAHLCARLDSVCRRSAWDFIQFKREEPDDVAPGRAIDIAIAPSGATIWIEGRQYCEYQTLLPIECKRLPTPGAARDPREYLYSQHNTTGGVDRFKQRHHGANHVRAAMIGYIQEGDVAHWHDKINNWVTGLAEAGIIGWSVADRLSNVAHDPVIGLARLSSEHSRGAGFPPIAIDHIWIEMSAR